MPRMNPALFEALQGVFGEVLVVKHGEEVRLDPNPAAAYLLGRGFDPAELWTRWRVACCTSSPDSRPVITHRIVFPIHTARRVTTADGYPTASAHQTQCRDRTCVR